MAVLLGLGSVPAGKSPDVVFVVTTEAVDQGALEVGAEKKVRSAMASIPGADRGYGAAIYLLVEVFMKHGIPVGEVDARSQGGIP